ncbi:MAG: polysaccharide biosynthesis tyrosine autokinase [Chthoniobacter sp.]|uniref:GumC family protein n=1 Tax=Chthoniobacter sp. TaxID=2510640 RepID=UPI0032AC2773
MDSTQHDNVPAGDTLDLLGFINTLRERLWIIAACVAVTCSIGLIYIIRTPKTYEAESVIQVDAGVRKVMDTVAEVTNEDLKDTEQLKTIEQNLAGPTVLGAVIEELKIQPAQLRLPARKDPYVAYELVHALQDSTTAKLKRGTRLISVTVENTDPVLAQKLSAEVVRQFTKAYIEQRVGISDEAYTFLRREKDRIEHLVADAQQAVQEFKDAHPGLPLDDSPTLADSRMLALANSANEARSARVKLESDYAQIQLMGVSKPEDLLRITSIASAPAVLSMENDVSVAESDFAGLKERYLPKHPKYIQAQRQLDQVHEALRRTILKASEAVGISLRSAKQTEENAAALLKKEEKAKLELSKVSLPYDSLTKELTANQDLYNDVKRRLRETSMMKGMEQGNVEVVQPAIVPPRPSKPKKLLVLIAAGMGGLIIGCLVAYALTSVDQTFKTVDQTEEELGLAVVGSVPLASKASHNAGALLTVQEPDSVVAESFRSLRAALSLATENPEQRSILFTSAIPGEGKTFCSVNYAVSLARLGERTLVIDGDLRLPTLHKYFFDELPEDGVGAVLMGECGLKSAIRPTKIENLFVLSAGRRIQQPAELLANGGFQKLMKEAAGQFDRIVVDSAPIHAVSDALLMLNDVEAVCLVIRSGKTPRRAVKRAVHMIAEAEGAISGVILNRLRASGAGYYYHYGVGEYGKGVYGAAKNAA